MVHITFLGLFEGLSDYTSVFSLYLALTANR